MNWRALSKVILIVVVVALAAISRAAPEQKVTPPPNAAAKAQWDPRQGKVSLTYHGTVVLDAVVVARDKAGKETRIDVTMQPAVTKGQKPLGPQGGVEQRLKFAPAKPQKGVKLVLRGTVIGSEEAFGAEESSGEKQKRFPYIRNSVGLSHNLRNNAVYDRRWDWVLIGPADGRTRIKPTGKKKGQLTFSWESLGGQASLELIFRPRFYQKHKNLKFYEPWTYKVWKGSVTGFCTWWAYKGGIDQKLIDRIVDVWTKEHLVDYGYKYLQIDAGWATGSSPQGYLNWNKKFPGGPKYIVERIKKAGMKPGVHTAIVFRKGDAIVDKMAKEHPDWFLQKPDGSVLTKGTYTLNPFNREGLAALFGDTYKGLKEQGWDYVKIDGMGDMMAWGYSQYPDHFKKLKATPAEALNRLNRAACDELGDGIYILGCWSVRPEIIGIVDGCRLGRDGFGPAEFQYFNSWNGVVWRNDPDHCDIQPGWVTKGKLPWYMECVDKMPQKPKPDTVAKLGVSDTIVRPCIVSMAGGVLMLSDKLEVYQDDKNMEGVKRSSPVLFTVPGQLYDYNASESDRIRNNVTDNLNRSPELRLHMRHPQMPHAPHYGKQPTWWMLEIDKPFENWSVLARFNWRKLPLHWNRGSLPGEKVRFSDLGLADEKEYVVYEFWSRKFLGKSKGSFTAPAQDASNGLQVFAIREARPHPWVISTTRHISQGGVSLLDEKWDSGGKVLSGKSAVVIGDPYVMTVHIPKGFHLKAAEVTGEKVKTEKLPDTAAVRITPSATKTVEWKMTFAK